MNDEMANALRSHQRGDLRQATLSYRAILARDPGHADALHMLGLVALRLGKNQDAVELIGRAAVLIPDSAAIHANLGEAYRAGGQLDQAARCCRSALRLQPDYPEAANNLGLVLLAQEDTPAAIGQFRAAIRLQPGCSLYHNNLGNALRVAGDTEGALAEFRRAVELDACSAEALGNLGQLLLEKGEREEALSHCREAVRLRPDLAEARNNLGNVLRELGRLAEAKECYREALRLNPNLAVTFNNMAQAVQEEGDLRSALTWYREALQREPNSPRIHANAASAFEERGEFDQAVRYHRRALDLDPRFVEAHNGLGYTLHQQGKFAESLAAYRAAIELRPAFAPGHCNLGNLLEEIGRLEDAETAYRTALRYDPDLPLAHAQLATLLRGRLPEDDWAALQRLLARPSMAIGKRLSLHFGMAHVLDGRGEYEAAAEHARLGNSLCLELWRTQGRRYDPQVHTAFVDNLIAAFDPAFFERTRGFGTGSERPVFVLGLPRSGTTLTEQILASHPQVFGAGELDALRSNIDAIPGLLRTNAPPAAALAGIDRETVQRLAVDHLDRLGALNGSAGRVVDKMTDNYLYLGLAATLFPKARFIHCRRDPRDVAVSCWMTNFRHLCWAADQEHIAARFLDYRRIMDHWKAVLPVPVLEVDYEETVTDLEGVARRLISWCGLSWDPACLDFHQLERPIRTASVTQVRQPVYQRSVSRWRHYLTSLASLFERFEALDTNLMRPRLKTRGS
jgi:tetratricopeptide (TPR) repeat protein